MAHFANDSEAAELLKRYLISSGKKELIGIPALEVKHYDLEVVREEGTELDTVRVRRVEGV